MKIKAWIYFLSMIMGFLSLLFGERIIRKEYALGIGFILLMFGLYKVSSSWQRNKPDDTNEE